MPPARTDIDPIKELAGLGTLRVWSVIISIFGDVIRAPDQAIAAPDLAALTARMGIKPDAQRVAIHRLKIDGWITAERNGRNSRYRLTEFGYAESERARPRIYEAPAYKSSGPFVLIVPSDGAAEGLKDAGFIQIAPWVYLGADDPGLLAGKCLVLRPQETDPPDWLRALVCPPGRVAAYGTLHHVLEITRRIVDTGPEPEPIDRHVLRILIIHRWRQLMLADPELPRQYFPRDWPGEDCRELMRELLVKLPG